MRRSWKLALAFGGLLVLAVVTAVRILEPPGPHFVCHRALDGALQQWKLEATNAILFPNVDGSSTQSLALILPYLGHDADALHDYGYVPGLHPDDPANLILFYVKEPSRRTWHGDTRRFTGSKRWVVLNPRMDSPDSGSGRAGGELCEAVSFTEFKDRLHATLDFLKRNERPGWQAAEQEHAGFLRSTIE